MIRLGGRDITGAIQDRLISITITDNSGEQSDEVEIELDDRNYAVAEPRKGAELTIALGYAGEPLQPLGRFVVDEVWPEGPPDILKIKGKAADMRTGLKAAKTRAWRETTINDIVSKIAGEHGLTPAVGGGLGGQAIQHRDQSAESDLHFLTRLGRDYGAVAAPKDGRLVFAPPASGVSASGRPLAEVALARGDLTDWKGVSADRDSYGTVKARYRLMDEARTAYAIAGSGEPARTLRTTYPDEASAKAAAEAELTRLGQATGGVELTMPGRPEIAAQSPIRLSGIRPSLCRRWIATTVTHRLDWSTGGFVTTVAANLTGKSEGA
ncbi:MULTISPECIES: contractile injection system protein, VgrG/Pvc8 family [Brevundimonas]|jgi:phage protein D|uniref:contractile injection system protein, VgrG/Pvc8 family n=1 Tax=Brevundimonas sp. TaxID=1871086 RepID=UPI0025BFF922|nr:contractile injection system protein, VgrG/Pvc8 family [Brevundimonas sp.]MCG2663345.1 hypothetical protein [Brevundimonas sp.]